MTTEQDLCARCGQDGEDRRTLWMACLYAMNELPIPFEQLAIKGRICRKIGEKKPYGSPVWSEPESDEHLRGFFTLRVCKRCRADWMRAIQDWFVNKPVEECDEDAHGVYIRDKGHTRLATTEEIKRIPNEGKATS